LILTTSFISYTATFPLLAVAFTRQSIMSWEMGIGKRQGKQGKKRTVDYWPM